MYSKRVNFARKATNGAMAIGLLVALLFASVGPAFALTGGTISSIVVGNQSMVPTYGGGGTVTYSVDVTSTGTGKFSATLGVAALPKGATGSFAPKSLAFNGAQTLNAILTVKVPATVPPGPHQFSVTTNRNSVSGLGALNINKALLGVTGITANNKVYDGNTSASLNTSGAALTNVLYTDVVSLVTSSAVGTFGVKDVGTRNVAISGLSLTGAQASRYVLPATVSTTAQITAAPLNVMGDDVFHYTGNPNPVVFPVIYDGFVNGETALVIPSAPTCGSSGSLTVAGTYPITCSGGSGGNYAFVWINDPAQGGGVLTVSDSNKPPTDITLPSSSVAENKPVGTVVGNFFTTDPERSIGEVYSYKLVSGVSGCDGTDNASFTVPSQIKSNGGVALRTAAVFHYQTKPNYSICVETNDGTLTFDKHFVIKVLPSKLLLYSQGPYDGWVLQSAPNGTVGGLMNAGATTLVVGDDKLNRQYRSILSFGTAPLPDNAKIYSIALKIKKASLSDPSLFTMLGGLMVDVAKPSFGKLTLELTDFLSMPATGFKAACAINPTPDSQGWYINNGGCTNAFPYINKAGPTQFRLYFRVPTNKNGVANTLSFYSGNSTVANAAELIIIFSTP